MDRWYQLYVVLVLLVILVLTWAYLLDLAEGIGATLGVPGASTLLGLLWVIPLVVCVTSVVHYLRTPSVPLTHPDIELLSGVLTPAAWVAASAVPVLLRSVVLGLIGGRLMGAVLQAVVSPVALTLAVAVALVLAVALGWACGLARLMRLVPHPCFDRASIVQSNALYADLQSMASWAAQAPITYEEQRRRRILAGRKPILSLPRTTGARLLVARALLSHLRQREGLKDLMEWGAFLVPAGAVLVASSADLGLRLMWMTLGSLSLGRARELTRVFRDDCRVRLVGDAIARPRTLFRLLLLDSLPAVALTVLLGLVAVACLSLPFPPSPRPLVAPQASCQCWPSRSRSWRPRSLPVASMSSRGGQHGRARTSYFLSSSTCWELGVSRSWGRSGRHVAAAPMPWPLRGSV